MKAGTIIKFPDGREATVVYRGLDGEGIIWGRRKLTPGDMEILKNGHSGICGMPRDAMMQAEEAGLVVEAMLREPYPSACVPCVGSDFLIWEDGEWV